MKSAEIIRILSQYDQRRDRRPEFILIPVDSMISLQNALIFGGVKWEAWGAEPGAKDINTLLKEVDEGETTFVRDRKGKLFRKVTKAVVDVVHRKSDGTPERLFEEIFDGFEWKRRNEEPSDTPGLKEKAKLRENPVQIAIRGLEEEMKLTELTEDELIGLIHLPISEKSKQTKKSDGYPGLKTMYSFDFFIFELPEERYQSVYEFEEGNRRMRLRWEEIV